MKSILMSLLLVTNNSNKLNYIGNDLKKPVFDSDIRYGYDERFFNKTENNEELIKISLDIKRQNLLKTLELLNNKIKISKIYNPEILEEINELKNLLFEVNIINSNNNSGIWKDIIDDWEDDLI